MSLARVIGLGLFLAGLSSPSAVLAQSQQSEDERLIELAQSSVLEARTFMRNKQYVEGIQLFEQAFRYFPQAQYLRAIAKGYGRIEGRCDDERSAWERYLRYCKGRKCGDLDKGRAAKKAAEQRCREIATSMESEAPDIAKDRYRQGREFFMQGELERAREEFQTALDVYPKSAKAAMRLARTFERLEKWEDAASAYEKYISNAPDANDRDAVERLIGSLKRRSLMKNPEVSFITTPAGAKVRLDGQATNLSETTPTKLRLQPGRHSVSFQREGFEPWKLTFLVEPEKTRTISATLKASGTPTADIVMWSSFGVGAVSLGLAGYFAAEFSSLKSDLEGVPAYAGDDPYANDRDTADSYGTNAVIFGALGAAAITTGFVLALMDDDESDRPKAGLGISPTGAVYTAQF